MMDFLAVFINTFVNVMEAVLIAYVILPFFVPPDNRFRAFVDSIVEFFLAPLRRVIPQAGPFDMAFMALWFLLILLQSAASMI